MQKMLAWSNAIRSWKLVFLDNSDRKNHIPKRPIFDEELHIEDDDSSLVENGKQQELDIDDDECFWPIWNMIVLIKRRLLEFNIWASWASFLGQLAQLYG